MRAKRAAQDNDIKTAKLILPPHPLNLGTRLSCDLLHQRSHSTFYYFAFFVLLLIKGLVVLFSSTAKYRLYSFWLVFKCSFGTSSLCSSWHWNGKIPITKFFYCFLGNIMNEKKHGSNLQITKRKSSSYVRTLIEYHYL